jgi:hypothetical protein
MENEKFILESERHCLIFSGQKESRHWTETKSNQYDGEYDVPEWDFKWKGILELTSKTEDVFFQIHFETFTLRRYRSSTVPDQSLKGMLFHSVKKPFDHSLFADFVAENVLKFIERRKSEKDQGLLGITAFFKENLFDEETLLSKGILTEAGGQMRMAVQA